jgi:hypothetical protein
MEVYVLPAAPLTFLALDFSRAFLWVFEGEIIFVPKI